MSSPRIDRSDDCSEPGGAGDAELVARPGDVDAGDTVRVRTEPVLALLGAASAGAGQLLTNVDALWVLLDIAAVLAAAAAAAMLLRAAAAGRGRPALAELATGVVTAGLCAAVLLLALHGPEARLGALVLEVAAALGTLLTVLIVGGATLRLRQEPPSMSGEDGARPGIGRPAGWVTTVAVVLAVVVVSRDLLLR